MAPRRAAKILIRTVIVCYWQPMASRCFGRITHIDSKFLPVDKERIVLLHYAANRTASVLPSHAQICPSERERTIGLPQRG